MQAGQTDRQQPANWMDNTIDCTDPYVTHMNKKSFEMEWLGM